MNETVATADADNQDEIILGRVYQRAGILGPIYCVFLEGGVCIAYFSRTERWGYYEYPQMEVDLAPPAEERQFLMDLRRYLRECIENKGRKK